MIAFRQYSLECGACWNRKLFFYTFNERTKRKLIVTDWNISALVVTNSFMLHVMIWRWKHFPSIFIRWDCSNIDESISSHKKIPIFHYKNNHFRRKLQKATCYMSVKLCSHLYNFHHPTGNRIQFFMYDVWALRVAIESLCLGRLDSIKNKIHSYKSHPTTTCRHFWAVRTKIYK